MHARRLNGAAARFVLPLRRLLSAGIAAAVLGGCAESAAPPQAWGNAERGMQVMHQYACNSCHMIPGITGSDVHVGPPLKNMARRQYIAGELPNTPENMMRWLLAPQAIDPLTAMPDMELTERDARDAAAYLATLY